MSYRHHRQHHYHTPMCTHSPHNMTACQCSGCITFHSKKIKLKIKNHHYHCPISLIADRRKYRTQIMMGRLRVHVAKHQSENIMFTLSSPIIPCARHFRQSAIRLIVIVMSSLSPSCHHHHHHCQHRHAPTTAGKSGEFGKLLAGKFYIGGKFLAFGGKLFLLYTKRHQLVKI